MRFDCLICGDHVFQIDGPSFVNDPTPVVTLSCPLCSAYHAIAHRPGGGLIVSIDQHVTHIEDARWDAQVAARANLRLPRPEASGTRVRRDPGHQE
jgi:hypothetical protein